MTQIFFGSQFLSSLMKIKTRPQIIIKQRKQNYEKFKNIVNPLLSEGGFTYQIYIDISQSPSFFQAKWLLEHERKGKEKFQAIETRNINCLDCEGKRTISLRGGGCGASKAQQQAEKLQNQPQNTVLLPQDFLQDMNKYLDIIISKAQLGSDQQQREEILIALQWFIAMKEHFNSLCQESKSVTSVFDLIFKSVPQLLKSLVVYIKISGFLCLQVLEIINDLCRALFTFYMKNSKRYMEIKVKAKLDELVSDFETQLEIEQSNIWIGGAEFELTMIKAVIQSSPNNSDEGQKLFKTFLGGLVSSVLTMSPSEDLINSLIEGAKFLYKENQVRNLKKNYEVYYYFESLKWYMIQLLRIDVSPKKVLNLLQNGFQNYIQNCKEWLLNFCWVKLIINLISFRPIISKQILASNLVEQQKIWNQLIKYKQINQFSFNKNLGRLLLFQETPNQEAFYLNYIFKRAGFQQFKKFNELLLNNLTYSSRNLFTFKNEIEKEQKQYDQLSLLFQENNELIESIENFNNQLIALRNLFAKIEQGFIKWQSLNKQNNIKQCNLQIDEIVENTQQLNFQCFSTFSISTNLKITFLLFFEGFWLVLNSIEQENTIKNEMENLGKQFTEKCQDIILSENKEKFQLIEALINLEIFFCQIKVQDSNHELITENYKIINQFFISMKNFILPFDDIIKRLQVIQEHYFKNLKLMNLTYNEIVQISVLEQVGEKVMSSNNFSKQIDFMFELFQSSMDQKRSNKLFP